MATVDKKITELTEKTSIPNTGIIHFVDTTDITQSPAGSSFKISKENLTKGAKIQTWTAGAYLLGDQVNYLGKDWVSNAATLATDVPGTSSKWIDRLVGKLNVSEFDLFDSTIKGKKFNSIRGGESVSGIQESLSRATFNKVVGATNSNVLGVYYKFEYNSLTDLNKFFTVDIQKISGSSISEMWILGAEGDWGPGSNSRSTGLSIVNGSVNGTMNIYDRINTSTDQVLKDYYNSKKVIYVLFAYYSTGDKTNVVFDYSIKFYEKITNGLTVASELTPSLEASILAKNSASILTTVSTKIAENSSVIENPFENIRSRDTSGFNTFTKKSAYSFNFKKVVGLSTNYINGVYIRFDYNDINELNKPLHIDFTKHEGTVLDTIKILNDVGDWGNVYDYPIDVVLNKSGSNTINLYNLIMATGNQAIIDYYTGAKSLQLTLAKYSGGVLSSSTPITFDYDVDLYFENINAINIATGFSEVVKSSLVSEIETSLGVKKTGIVFWGDSLTAGGGWTTTLGTLANQMTYNGGTGGENSRTILARQGGDAMIVNNKTIPATTTPVILYDKDVDGSIKTQMGGLSAPLLQGGSSHVNPVILAGIEGTLTWTGSSYNDPTGNWTFTRSVAGTEVVIDRPSTIITAYDRLRNNTYLSVIFSGQNGGHASDSELITFHRWMIAHADNEHTIVLGLSSGSASSRANYETLFKAEFGRYFISLREYLASPIYDVNGTTIISCYGLADSGLTATQADLSAIATGTVPPQMLADSVHYTTLTKTVIGNYLYKKCVELNIF